jgi:hypothetical protein
MMKLGCRKFQQQKILNSKHVQFLEFASIKGEGDLTMDLEDRDLEAEIDPEEVTKELEPDKDGVSVELELKTISIALADDDAEIAESLIPAIAPLSRVLRDQNTKVKPVKFTYLTSDPASFKRAIEFQEGNLWKEAADKEITSIEHHEVWEDAYQHPGYFLCTTWVFQTKPATASAQERKRPVCAYRDFLKFQE